MSALWIGQPDDASAIDGICRSAPILTGADPAAILPIRSHSATFSRGHNAALPSL